MKQLLAGMLLLVILTACSEEDDAFVDPRRLPPAGTASALLNGKTFVLAPRGGDSGCDSDRLSVNFVYYNENEFARISIVIGNFPTQLGKYSLSDVGFDQSECDLNTTYANLYTLLDDGDVVGPSFQLVEEADNNELVITRYDSAARQLEGHFQMTLAGGPVVIDDLSLPDTLRITYGTFELQLEPPEE